MFAGRNDEANDIKALEAAWINTKTKIARLDTRLSRKDIKKLGGDRRVVICESTTEEQIQKLAKTPVQLINFTSKYIRKAKNQRYKLKDLLAPLAKLRWLVCSFEKQEGKTAVDNFRALLPQHVRIYRLIGNQFTLIHTPTVTTEVLSLKRKPDADLVSIEEGSDLIREGKLEKTKEKENLECIIEKLQYKKLQKKKRIEVLEKNLEEQRCYTAQAEQALAKAHQELAELKSKMVFPVPTPVVSFVEEECERGMVTTEVATPNLYFTSVVTEVAKSPFTLFGITGSDEREIIKVRMERDQAIKEKDEAREKINYLYTELAMAKDQYEKNFLSTIDQIAEDCIKDPKLGPEKARQVLKYMFTPGSFADPSLEIRPKQQSAETDDIIEIGDDNMQPKF